MCAHESSGVVCGAETERRYLQGWRCEDHTPARLAGRPEPSGGDPLRDRAITPQSDSRVYDDRAIKSGKRRSSVSRYREAQGRQPLSELERRQGWKADRYTDGGSEYEETA